MHISPSSHRNSNRRQDSGLGSGVVVVVVRPVNKSKLLKLQRRIFIDERVAFVVVRPVNDTKISQRKPISAT